jgi:hypothetical protein
MRIAFSIILNGLHHLQHKNYFQTILNNFDYWIVVEGQALPNGSTAWCKLLNDKYQINGRSVDGTHEFLSNLSSKNNKLIYVPSNGPWSSKDEMVNKAIEQVKKITDKCFLWEIDIDEHWTLEQIIQAEEELVESNSKTGCFLCEYFVTDQWISIGGWGEGKKDPYRRLWNWEGENFKTHEPPVIDSPNQTISLLSPKFIHYAYYFERDAKFKSEYYGGHEHVLEGFYKLKNSKNDTEPLSILFPESMFDYHNSTYLKKKSHIHLLIDYYKFKEPNPERQSELDTCLIDNITNDNFYKVHVFSNDELPKITDKVIQVSTSKRLEYKEYFEYAKNNIPEGDIIVLSNSDMYFDDTISKITKLDLNNTVLALTRWCPEHGHKIIDNNIHVYANAEKSQDVWIWKSFLKNYESVDCNFTLGVLGCDNKIAHSFSQMGYDVINPSLEIITYHLHKNDSTRIYDPVWLPGPYLFVKTEETSFFND